MDLTEAQLNYIMSSALLLGIVLGWPALTTAIALMREYKVLGRLYWHWKMALDRRQRNGRCVGEISDTSRGNEPEPVICLYLKGCGGPAITSLRMG